jgi:PhnB protein
LSRRKVGAAIGKSINKITPKVGAMPRPSKSRRKAPKRKATKKVPPVPPGFRTVTPYLSVHGAADAINFYKKALGAKELLRQTTPDGRIIHARLKIGDSIVMLSDQFQGPATGAESPVTLHIYSKDVNKLWSQAVAAGAKVRFPLDDAYWGERYGQFIDPFGHRWSISMQIKMSKGERERKQKESMAMFDQNRHPGEEATQEVPSSTTGA